MGDRRVGEDAFYIVLEQGEQVSRKHGSCGDDRKDREQGTAEVLAMSAEVTQEERKDRALGDGSNKSGYRRRGAFIDIGRPQMEGDDPKLEPYANQQQYCPRQEYNAGCICVIQQKGKPAELHGAC